MPKVRLLVGCGLLLACALPATAAPDADARRADALAMAARIDQHLQAGWTANKIVPTPVIDDGAFLRRVYLHLAGRIPSVYEARRFLEDKDPNKRRKEVETLLNGQRYPMHMANVWRSFMLPEAFAGSDARGLGFPLEGWLRSRFAMNAPYDKMVRELLTVPLPPRQAADGFLVDIYGADPGDGASPLSFYRAKQFKPENLADATARVLLGVRLGCAQCHNHPTASWKRERFWEYTAFFAVASRAADRNQPNQPVEDKPAPREIKIPELNTVVQAKFLDGKAPAWKENDDPRVVLADWMTSKENRFFARAVVNRVWWYFFGAGIMDPVDEMVGTDSQPSHPELLDELAKDFAAHDFDLKYLILAITSSKAYQRGSARTDPSQDEPRQFSRAPLLGMTPEQLFDSVAEATRYGSGGAQFNPGAREEFLAKFSNLSDRPTEYQTSMIQALALMNGRLTADATSLENSRLLAAVITIPGWTTEQRGEALYLATLTRKPNAKEIARVTKFIDDAVKADDKALSEEEKNVREKRALADVFWALLNSGEFFFNH